MQCAVIIPAAGAGTRFAGGDQADPLGAALGPSKIEIDLNGKPAFLRAVELFLSRPAQVSQILLAVNPDAIDDFRFKWADKLAFHDVKLVPGGRRQRWETVRRALEAVDAGATHIAVHDAARPLASRTLVDRLLEAAQRYDAVIPALPVANTLKRVGALPVADEPADPLDAILGDGGKLDTAARRVVETVSRDSLVEAQTPQVFNAPLLRRAYEQVSQGKLDPAAITDDAGLIEALGEPVYVIDGESTNIKITRPEDAEFAAAVVQMREGKQAKELAKKRLFGDDDE